MGQKPRLDLRVSQRPALSAGQRAGLDLLTRPAADLRRELER